MAGQLGVSPLAFNIHLLWELVCGLIVKVPLGTVATRLNAASAVCAAGTLWLLVRLVAAAIFMTIEVDDRNRRAAVRAARLGGLAAGLFLAVSMPFWYAANRFHVATFDLMLLLGLAYLLLGYMRDPAPWKGPTLGLAYGLGAVEFPALIVFGPVVLIGVLMTLRKHGELRWGRVLPTAAGLLVGLLAYGLTAWRFQGSDVFQASFAGAGYGRALYLVLRMHYGLVARSLPQLGWLLVIITGIVPWLAMLLVGRRGLNAEKDWGLYVLHVILTGVTMAVLFNAPFAPWALMGRWRLIVTPYVLLAVVFGYLTAYWFLLPRMYLDDDDDYLHVRWRERVGWMPAVLLLAAPLAAGVLNFKGADARAAGAVNGYVRAAVESVGTRTWLLTDGAFDDNILVVAREAGKPLRTINLRYANHAPYLGFIGRQFDTPRLRSLAEVDLFAFLREWMTSDARFNEQVAFMILPDLWLSSGYQPIPDRVLFRGVRSASEVDPKSLWETHQAFWARPFIADLGAVRKDPTIGPLAGYALRHLSMVANNTGVLLEELGWQKQSYEAYQQARQLDKDNISAMLNQGTLVDRGYATPEADRIRAELKTMVEGLKYKLQIWALARTYGYVRLPQAYADMGMVWALSGEPGMAVAGFKKAIAMEPGARDQLTYGLAAAYLAQDQAQEGESLYRQLLEKNPADTRALVGLARLLALGGKIEEAGTLLDRAGKAGVSKDRIAMEYATLHLAAGDLPRARIVLQELTELKPELSTAWAMLAAVLLQQKDTQALEDCERKLDRIKEKDFIALFVLGQIALRKTDYVSARVLFDKAQALRPSNPLVLEQLLGLDIREGREDLAGMHVRSLLLIDAGHPFANHVLGSLQLKRQEYALAENSLRKSVERRRTPEALNDLAWVLQERGSLEEAETLVREAIKGNDKFPAMWDTLGVILMKRGLLDEAETAIKKSVAIYAEDLGVQTHLAELYAKKGDLKRAAELAEGLLARGSELKLSDREKLRKLVRLP
jgi:tetratricopeptide (TPR) repeat protein